MIESVQRFISLLKNKAYIKALFIDNIKLKLENFDESKLDYFVDKMMDIKIYNIFVEGKVSNRDLLSKIDNISENNHFSVLVPSHY